MKRQKISPFLTFNGQAEEAMQFYAQNLPNASIITLVHYGKDHPMAEVGDETRVLHGSISILGQELKFLDMTKAYPAPDFSWSSSIYLDCENEAEFDTVFNALAADGQVMMGPESVAHIRKCAWVVDKFGVTWQPVWE